MSVSVTGTMHVCLCQLMHGSVCGAACMCAWQHSHMSVRGHDRYRAKMRYLWNPTCAQACAYIDCRHAGQSSRTTDRQINAYAGRDQFRAVNVLLRIQPSNFRFTLIYMQGASHLWRVRDCDTFLGAEGEIGMNMYIQHPTAVAEPFCKPYITVDTMLRFARWIYYGTCGRSCMYVLGRGRGRVRSACCIRVPAVFKLPAPYQCLRCCACFHSWRWHWFFFPHSWFHKM